MFEVEIDSMNLEQIAGSGQCFRIRRLYDGCFSITAMNHYLEIRQEGKHFDFSCTKEEFLEIWRQYFDLDTDYSAIKRKADPEDEYLSSAIQYGGGIRILRQDLWEIIVTFLISQNNNISRITKSIDCLCESLGEKRVSSNGVSFHTFPTAKAVTEAGEAALKGLGLGYRDKYVWKIAKRAAEGTLDLEGLKQARYEEAYKQLTAEFGIGRKVADCICLFGLHFIDAFPVDTHIRKILDRHYPNGFPYQRYQGYLGVVQQYLFYYDLMNGHSHGG